MFFRVRNRENLLKIEQLGRKHGKIITGVYILQNIGKRGGEMAAGEKNEKLKRGGKGKKKKGGKRGKRRKRGKKEGR